MKALFLAGPVPQSIRLIRGRFQIADGPPVAPPDFEYDTIFIGCADGFVSYPALKALGRWGITIALMGWGGTPLSTFVPWRRNDAPLRLAQLRAALDTKVCLKVARALVEAKTGTSLPPNLDTVPRVRAAESVLARTYWEGLGVERRSGFYKTLNAKATTPTNAAINYAQGVLAVICRTAISKVGLDPAVGFLHNPAHDTDAFVYDWQEPFRSVADRVAIDYARDHPDAFLRDDDWVYRFKYLAARALVAEVEAALNQTVRYDGERVSVDSLMVRELRRFGGWLRHPTSTLSFVSPQRSTCARPTLAPRGVPPPAPRPARPISPRRTGR
jgi:CRISPR/Cas system-associated endonuclease Cas1